MSSEEEKSLTVVEQKQVEFYGDEILAVRVENGAIYIPVRPITDLLGLSWPSQYNRINRDPVLSETAKNISIFVTNTQGQSQHRQMLSLPLDFVSGFLFGIRASRVKSDLKERLIRYQRECYRVLSEAFSEGRLTTEPAFDELLRTGTPAAQAYRMAAAIMKMARQQLLLESQLETHAAQLSDHEQRIEEIEITLGDPGRHITPEQAMQISQAVKTVAMELEKRSKKNEYGAVYGQLYREFGITSYKQLPANKFDQAMAWLTNWYGRITGDTGGLPF